MLLLSREKRAKDISAALSVESKTESMRNGVKLHIRVAERPT